MAVNIRSIGESHTGTSGSTSQASFSWSQPLFSSDKGVLVFTFTNANADDATAVSFGGTSLTAVSGGRAVDTSGEPGDCKAWFLGSGMPAAPNGAAPSGNWAKLFTPSLGRALLYANNTWVLGQNSGTILTSSAASGPWTAATSNTSNIIVDVDYSNSTWVVIAATDVRYATDPTGSWSSGTSLTGTPRGIAGGGGYWVVVGDAGYMRYTNNLTGTWSTPTSVGFGASSIKGIAYHDGTWVAVGDGGQIRTTTDPTGTWSAATSTAFAAGANLQNVAYGNGTWVTVGQGSKIGYATDPTGTWSAPSNTNGISGEMWGVAYGNGYWVAYGQYAADARYTTSPSGTWSAPSSFISTGQSINHANVIAYGDGWLYGSGDGVYTPDTASITVTRTNNANEMYAVAITVLADYNVSTTGVTLIESDGTLAEQSIDDGSPGTNSLRFAGINSGLANIVTGSPGSNDLAAGSSSTWAQNIDYGTRVAGVVYETTAGQGGRNVGFAATTSDDRAAVHLAIREAIVPWTVGVPIR